MSTNLVVIGAQWGDEGKGKIVDLLTEKAGAVVRYQGGHNAGHTLVIDDFYVVAELIVIPFPGFDDIADADAHLLYAADDFFFHEM